MSNTASPLTATEEESPNGWQFFSVWYLTYLHRVLSSLKEHAKSLLTVSFDINKNKILAAENQTSAIAALINQLLLLNTKLPFKKCQFVVMTKNYYGRKMN